MGFARQEASKFNVQYISTEHLLLGLVVERGGVAANVIRMLGVTEDQIRDAITRVCPPGPTLVSLGQLPFTPRLKKALELAAEEAQGLRHQYIGTEHLLLGLLREQEGVAARVLNRLGLSETRVRNEIMELIGGPTDDPRVSHNTEHADYAALVLAESPHFFDRYQEFTRTTAVFPGAGQPGFNSAAYLAFGLTGEAGETAEKLKKRYRLGGVNAFLPGSVVVYEKTGEVETYEQFRDKVRAELGDVLWYVAGLADHFGLRLSDVAGSNVEKLSSRKERGVLKGAGDNR
jgi:NTP pyrophosphatase (non-canonical NTP hydrolase)